MSIARVTALRSTCPRRSVGCVLADRFGKVLATGYNGVPTGMEHCKENGGTCPACLSESGKDLDGCHAVHAEQNALMQCSEVRDIYACYVTTSPCMTCVKMLMNTGCRVIWYDEPYPNSLAAGELWLQMGQGRQWGLSERSLHNLR